MYQEKLPTDETLRALAAAESAIAAYLDTCRRAGISTERLDFLEHARTVETLVRVYNDGHVAPEVYAAALMHDLPGRFYSENSADLRREPALVGLLECLTDPLISDTSRGFILGLLADLPSVERGAEQCRNYKNNPANLQKIMRGEYKGKISAKDSLWETDAKIDSVSSFISNLRDQAVGHSVEAVQIKAAEAIANLQKPAPDDAAALRDVIEAETFYAPLCEVWGLDAMAMSLRSEATKLRYRKMGLQDLLDQAAQLRNEVLKTDIVDGLRRMLGASHIDFDYSPNAVVTDDNIETATYYSGTIVGGSLDGRAIRMRLKSIGSIAKKIRNSPNGVSPSDIFAVTIIADSHEQNAKDFIDVVQKIRSENMYELRAAPSKKFALATQGSEIYMRMMDEECEKAGLDIEFVKETYLDKRGKKRERPKEYHVTKCTGVYKTTEHEAPFEIQFLDVKNRMEARIGEQAHIIFKLIRDSGLKLSEEDKLHIKDVLSETYRRVDNVDKTARKTNSRSQERSAQLIRDLEIYLMTHSLDHTLV